MKREGKIKSLILILGVMGILLLSLVSASWFDWVKKTITGKATTVPFDLNITVGGPEIITVYNQTDAVTINEGPDYSEAIINFTVYIPVGVENLNLSTAKVNLSFTNEDTRTNASCKVTDYEGDYANFTCNVTMWWWDANDTWTINAYIKDNASNAAINTTQIQDVGEQQSVLGGPSLLTWSGVSPGAWNSTSTNDPLLLNNSGNFPSANITLNATHLRGETDNTELIYAGNFSVHWNTGGSPPTECNNTARMMAGEFIQVMVANLTKGNYTKNNGNEGQEKLYFCLLYLHSNLSTQAYSTVDEGQWEADML